MTRNDSIHGSGQPSTQVLTLQNSKILMASVCGCERHRPRYACCQLQYILRTFTEPQGQHHICSSRACCSVTGTARRTNFIFRDGARTRRVVSGGYCYCCFCSCWRGGGGGSCREVYLAIVIIGTRVNFGTRLDSCSRVD